MAIKQEGKHMIMRRGGMCFDGEIGKKNFTNDIDGEEKLPYFTNEMDTPLSHKLVFSGPKPYDPDDDGDDDEPYPYDPFSPLFNKGL